VSESMDMDFVFEKEAPAIKEYLDRFAPVGRQVGAVFLVDGNVVGMDAFGKAETFTRVFKNLLESYALDAVDRYEKDTGAAGDWEKHASDLLAAASAAKAESRPSVGLGLDLRIESERLIGFALEHKGRVVHVCLFTNDKNRRIDNTPQVVRPSSRCQRRGV
jgi:hypothetical protein